MARHQRIKAGKLTVCGGGCAPAAIACATILSEGTASALSYIARIRAWQFVVVTGVQWMRELIDHGWARPAHLLLHGYTRKPTRGTSMTQPQFYHELRTPESYADLDDLFNDFLQESLLHSIASDLVLINIERPLNAQLYHLHVPGPHPVRQLTDRSSIRK